METNKVSHPIRFDPVQLELIKLAAKQERISPAEWIRRAADERLQRSKSSKKGSKNVS